MLSLILILKSYSTCGVGYGTQHLASIGARSNSANTYRCLGFGTSSKLHCNANSI
ncbi:hypothetical protein LEP1GSC021_1356 [Leptospira noguchii str. 1993005606]|uniref:Lipoprotein n=1 Tax=Leptospira noguchii str. 2007001578 TaxID=1049974 RepID=A0ABN0J7D2_9LEPT|nr:hypothetical protein LEP1GSC035_3414 [Leptospira noguchii str. 2007001578]EPE83237.1 hypothetical protein LEP1GSC021_1356 [Leptospira noguchii str. 1993005606]